MRPLTLKRILETLIVIERKGVITKRELRSSLGVGKKRIREIVAQLRDQRLVAIERNEIACTEAGLKIVDSIENNDWRQIHSILLESVPEYFSFITILKQKRGTKGSTFQEIIQISKNFPQPLNQTTAELCSEWSRRLQVVQKNLHTSGLQSRFYLTRQKSPSLEQFKRILFNNYNKINNTQKRKRVYVGIPRLREFTCEEVQILRECFDRLLAETFYSEMGRIELSGGPITSKAKKTPSRQLGLRTIKIKGFSLPFPILEEQRGLELDGIKYQTVVFHF